jgi:hypothetical protein
MHNCEEFRERITEHIIDREDLTADPRFRSDLLICSDCCEFYLDSREMMNAFAAVDASVRDLDVSPFRFSRKKWGSLPVSTAVDAAAGFSPRLVPVQTRAKVRDYVPVLKWASAVAAVLLITVGLTRIPQPVPNPPATATIVEQPLPLDPVTVDFLQQSELLLRNVVKLTPNDTEDLADVKRMAGEQLLAIDQRKDAAAQVPPVLNVMDTYETVLRDIRNVDERRGMDDVQDIQSRIQRDGLIANIKAFQPRVTPVSYTPH